MTHVEGEVNPVRDLDIISEELRLKDVQNLTKIIVSCTCLSMLFPVSVYYSMSQDTISCLSILFPVSVYYCLSQYTIACLSILLPVSVYYCLSQYTIATEVSISILLPVLGFYGKNSVERRRQEDETRIGKGQR